MRDCINFYNKTLCLKHQKTLCLKRHKASRGQLKISDESSATNQWLILASKQLSTVNCQLSTNLDVQVKHIEFGAEGFDELAAGGDSIAH